MLYLDSRLSYAVMRSVLEVGCGWRARTSIYGDLLHTNRKTAILPKERQPPFELRMCRHRVSRGRVVVVVEAGHERSGPSLNGAKQLGDCRQ